MGIAADSVRLLLDCKKRGVLFTRTLMVGRQNVFLGSVELRRLLTRFGLKDDPRFRDVVKVSGDFAEPLFKALGADTVESMDASEFEGATIVHDLNLPIPAHFHEQFDLVFDGGSLEHVFDFPRAMLNCMQMVKIGGHLILHTPSNNFMGHGFYKLSPDLFFRVLTRRHGFQVRRMIARELGPRIRWFEVSDPVEARSRGAITNRFPVILHVEAQKLASSPQSLVAVQQSDYSIRWDAHTTESGTDARLTDIHAGMNPGLRRLALDKFPGVVRVLERIIGIYFARDASFRARTNYRPISRRPCP